MIKRSETRKNPAPFRLQTQQLSVVLGRHFWGAKARTNIFELLKSFELIEKINSLFKPNTLNFTEGRPVTHTVWRDPASAYYAQNLKYQHFLHDIIHQQRITDIVNVGIGGSYLGNALACEALKTFQAGKIKVHFLSAPDPTSLEDLFPKIDPHKTLWLFVSKSFSTLETLVLLEQIKAWFFEYQPQEAFEDYFFAITNQPKHAQEQGFSGSQCLLFDDGVGGRFSLWSPVGMIIAMAIGKENYQSLLAGAHAMDQHFLNTPLDKNIPVWLAWLDYFYSKFFHATSRMVEPYTQRLNLLPAYLQQLEMESLGKSAKTDGSLNELGLVVWGGVGPEGQHAFHQFLYQNQQLIPAEFIVIRKSQHFQDVQDIQFAQCLAQAKALWEGNPNEKDLHKRIESFNPSTLIILEELTPFTFGQLLAMYEHKVFMLGELYQINPFDQFGVELGKKLTQPILNKARFAELDEITKSLLS
jgi:glucose-6-phosphate isomerase